MTVFNLEHFPNVCRLCLKPEQNMRHTVDDNFEKIRMQIKAFLEEITFRPSEDKVQQLPKFVCEECIKQLTDFAIYRNRLTLSLRFMEALVDLKNSNSGPITDLFKDCKNELDGLFKELSLCSKSEPQVDDLLQEFESYNFVSCNSHVKKEDHSESDDDDVKDDLDYDFHNESSIDVVTKPDIDLYNESNSNKDSGDSSSDDEPLAKKKKKTTKPTSSRTAQNSGPKRIGRPRIHPEGRHLKEPWSCGKCKFVTKYRIAVDRHKAVHERREKRTYPCTVCGEEFKTKDAMRTHGFIHPENQIVCEICGLALKSSTSLKSHMERHEEKRKYACEYCEYASYTKLSLKAHMKIHTTDNDNERCEICGSTFKKNSHLKRHMEGHSNERKYACEQCPRRFNTKNALRNHHIRVHLGIRHPCEYCDKTFDQRIILRDHIERVHQIQCNFICDICVVTFDSQEKLDLHRQRHENPKPMECRVCLTIHLTQEAFDGHLCITYRDDYQCCNKDLRNHSQYNRHMLTKHGLKTNVRVKPIPGMLLGNIRGTRKRLEQCRKCDIAFPSKALKMQHMIECNRSTAAAQVEYSSTDNEAAMHRY